MLRIGLVSKFHAADGLCTVANAVLDGLTDKSHEVHVFTQSPSVGRTHPQRVHRFAAVQLNPHFSLDSPSAVRMIAEVCREHDIEVLNVQMNSGSTEFLLPYFKRSLPPLVVTFHLAYAAGPSAFTTLFAVAWKASVFAARKYDRIVLVDPSQEAFFAERGVPEARITVIRNGVDTKLFAPSEKGKEDALLDFIYVGRLSLDKGVDVLLRAFERYHAENHDCRLTLIGDGMLKSRLNRYTSRGAIRWLGILGHDQIPLFLQNADVFVIPQNIGGLGMSVLEAMSCGLPVVTTGIGETTRLLSDDEGILVQPRNVDAVVRAMELLGSDEKLRRSMGMRCRRKILREYSWASQIELLERVFAEVVSQQRG